MNRVHAVIFLGIGLIIVGAIWMIGSPEVDIVKTDYELSGRAYQDLIYTGWRVLPTVIFLLGLLCLIAGVAGSREVTI